MASYPLTEFECDLCGSKATTNGHDDTPPEWSRIEVFDDRRKEARRVVRHVCGKCFRGLAENVKA
jgi:hypothetical protein